MLLGAFLLFVVVLAILNAQRQSIAEIGQIIAYALAAGSSLWVGAHSPNARVRWGWWWIALACACNAIGEGVYAYLVLIGHHANPFPSLADVFYVLFYPCMVIGVSLLPAVRVKGTQRFKVALDACIIAGSLLSVSWFFLLGPLYLQGADTPFSLALSLTYPVGDVLIVVALLLVSLRGVHPPYRLVYVSLLLGMLFFVYADSAYTYLGLQGSYVAGALGVDTFWIAGALCICLAAAYQVARFGRNGAAWMWLRSASQRRMEEQPSESPLRIVLPYIPVIGLLALVVIALSRIVDSRLLVVIEGLAIFVIGAIILRQIVTLRENAHLVRVQSAWLTWQANVNGEIEDQRQTTARYARDLEVGIQQVLALQAPIAKADYHARIRLDGIGRLYPVASLMNQMLDQVERTTQQAQQYAPLAQLALILLTFAGTCAKETPRRCNRSNK